ncbi:DUF2914 domain-containing protein [Plesiocystis pacifica]|nr:DUF2914 domain-containing protein [Plesiocystis pacifica]
MLAFAPACDSGSPPSQPSSGQAKADAAAEKAPSKRPAEAETDAKPEAPEPAEPEPEPSAAPTENADAPAEVADGTGGTEPAAAEAGAAEAAAPEAAKPTDPRDPAHLPPDTPAANKKAFSRLPVTKTSLPPVGGAGVNGIHLDMLEIGRGWHQSRCDLVGDTFTVGSDERVNVCMRVIHPRGEPEELTIYWERDGKLNQRSKVKVSKIPAYLTRGWLPITEARKGKWKATIKSADGAVLGEVEFTIN